MIICMPEVESHMNSDKILARMAQEQSPPHTCPERELLEPPKGSHTYAPGTNFPP